MEHVERMIVISEIQWIFFDVGSTLTDEKKAYEYRLRTVADVAHVSYEYVMETVVSLYRENRDGCGEIMRMLQVSKPAWRSDLETLYPDAEECLHALHGKYKIGIIANQPLGTAQRMQECGIAQYIDLTVSSAEEGVAKPDMRIFEIALSRADCPACRAVMVGDRIDNDIVPAKKLGMRTVRVLRGFGSLWQVTRDGEAADHTVSDLRELPELLA